MNEEGLRDRRQEALTRKFIEFIVFIELAVFVELKS